MIRLLLSSLLFLFLLPAVSAQYNIKPLPIQHKLADSARNVVLIGLSAGYNIPAATLAKRFGAFKEVEISASFKAKKNWIAGIHYNYCFGNTVKETGLFNSLLTKDTMLIGKQGNAAEIRLYARLYYVQGSFGKLFTVGKRLKNSGILVMGHVGYMQHRIKILGDNVYQLSDEYKKGYDRLSGGIAVGQSVGYLHLSPRQWANYSISLTFTEGFTTSYRTINFDTGKKDNTKRIDILMGAKFCWYLPIYNKKTTGTFNY